MIQSTGGDIILDYQIKTHDWCIARVEFLQETLPKRAHLAKLLMQKKDINVLYAELVHPSDIITHATSKTMGLHLTITFNTCEDCALGKAKRAMLVKQLSSTPNFLGERPFFDISSPLTTTLGGKKPWLLVMEDGTDYARRHFKKKIPSQKYNVGLN